MLIFFSEIESAYFNTVSLTGSLTVTDELAESDSIRLFHIFWLSENDISNYNKVSP